MNLYIFSQNSTTNDGWSGFENDTYNTDNSKEIHNDNAPSLTTSQSTSKIRVNKQPISYNEDFNVLDVKSSLKASSKSKNKSEEDAWDMLNN